MQSSAHRPVLGVICCNRSIDGQAGQAVMTRYLNSALRYAEAAGLLIPALPELFNAREVAPRIDGLLLTGTPSNLDPKRYGAPAEAALGPFDPARNDITSELTAAMRDPGPPGIWDFSVRLDVQRVLARASRT